MFTTISKKYMNSLKKNLDIYDHPLLLELFNILNNHSFSMSSPNISKFTSKYPLNDKSYIDHNLLLKTKHYNHTILYKWNIGF